MADRTANNSEKQTSISTSIKTNGPAHLGEFDTYRTRLNGPRREKTCLRWFANNTGADQPAHPRSLISAYVIRFLKRIICKLATGGISIF